MGAAPWPGKADPTPLNITSVTVYVLAAAYTCVGLAPEPVVPSPNSHRYVSTGCALTVVNALNAAADANKLPEAQGLTTNINVNFPQLFVHVDREKVKSLGISLTDLFQTQQAMLSTLYINDFNIYGKTFRVQAEAQPQFRERPEDVGRLYVRSPAGQMIPVSSLVTTEFKGAPNIVTRFNGFTAAVVNGTPAPGSLCRSLLRR